MPLVIINLSFLLNIPEDRPTEHLTAVTVSVKDKLTLSLGVAVGSSIVSYVCQRKEKINSHSLPSKLLSLSFRTS